MGGIVCSIWIRDNWQFSTFMNFCARVFCAVHQFTVPRKSNLVGARWDHGWLAAITCYHTETYLTKWEGERSNLSLVAPMCIMTLSSVLKSAYQNAKKSWALTPYYFLFLVWSIRYFPSNFQLCLLSPSIIQFPFCLLPTFLLPAVQTEFFLLGQGHHRGWLGVSGGHGLLESTEEAASRG